jgi:hypothetical protein
MAAQLPDGATVLIATTYGSAKTVSAVTNASPAVATSTAHGLSNGALVLVASGWSRLNARVLRLASVATNSAAFEGFDSSSTSVFTPGGGIGTMTEITALTQISQIMGFETTGGDQQFVNYSFLEQDFETQLPTITSAQSIKISIADDPSLAGYIALKAAGEARATRALKLLLKDGSFVLYNGVVSFNETPTVTKGAIMTVSATFSLTGRPVRYAS